jgi:hypothetical protein
MLKIILSAPGFVFARTMASRREPVPESALEETVKSVAVAVLQDAKAAKARKRNRNFMVDGLGSALNGTLALTRPINHLRIFNLPNRIIIDSRNNSLRMKITFQKSFCTKAS